MKNISDQLTNAGAKGTFFFNGFAFLDIYCNSILTVVALAVTTMTASTAPTSPPASNTRMTQAIWLETILGPTEILPVYVFLLPKANRIWLGTCSSPKNRLRTLCIAWKVLILDKTFKSILRQLDFLRGFQPYNWCQTGLHASTLWQL